MPYLDVSKSQFKKMLDEYINEELSEEQFHHLIIKLIKDYRKWNGCYFSDIKKLVDKFDHDLYNKEIIDEIIFEEEK